MRRFTKMYDELDATTRTSEKLAAIERYFRDAPAGDAAWALWLLVGNRLKRVVTSTELRLWACQRAGVATWMLDECYASVGDLGETIALLLPTGDAGAARGDRAAPTLAEVIQEHLIPMRRMDEAARRERMMGLWSVLEPRERFVLHKLVSGTYRVGVSRAMAVRGLAAAVGVDPAVIEHRVMGQWAATPEALARICAPVSAAALQGTDAGADGDAGVGAGVGAVGGGGAMRASAMDVAQPYPFYLALQLPAHADEPARTLGEPGEWIAEWKFDGVRCQLLRRGEALSLPVLWSRGEEVTTDRFPEIASAAQSLSVGTVLDGEVLAWEAQGADGDSLARTLLAMPGRPAPFAMLQTRMQRKGQSDRLFHDVPVVFVAYDVLEHDGHDVRGLPQIERRALLESIIAGLDGDARRAMMVSPRVDGALVGGATWGDLATLRERSREIGVEGLMLKHRLSPYGQGRRVDAGASAGAGGGARGWWKWKIDPFVLDAVLVYAQRGSGRRASLYSDYTFALWSGPARGEGELVPFAKAYSGLSDNEMAKVDAFIRTAAIDRSGEDRAGSGFRVVRPELVFEIAFEGVAISTRHRSGLSVRFPRMSRWRTDKSPTEADTLATLRAMLPTSVMGAESRSARVRTRAKRGAR
jgi:DNA ligase-1